MASNRSKTPESFAQHANRLESLEKRLTYAEDAIRMKIGDVDRVNPIYFFQAGLTSDEYEWVFLQLRMLLDRARILDWKIEPLLSQYRRVFIAALVASAYYTRTTTRFWPVFWSKLELDQNSEVENQIRRGAHSMLGIANLRQFDDADLGNKQYVNLFFLNAGLSVASLPQLVEIIRQHPGAAEDAEDAVPAIRSSILNSGSNSVLINFVQFSAQIVNSILARIIEIVRAFDSDLNFFAGLDDGDTNGLPEPTFIHLKALLLNDSTLGIVVDSSQKRSLQNPKIVWDHDSGELQLQLPSLVAKEDGTWNIDFQNEAIELPYRAKSHAPIESITVPYPSNSDRVFVSARELGFSWECELEATKTQCLFFQPDGTLLQKSNFRGSRIGIAAPADSEVLAFLAQGDSVALTPYASFEVTNWHGWRIGFFDTDEVVSIRVTSPAGKSSSLSLSTVKTLTWDFSHARPLESTKGVDAQPVYGATPFLRLPGSVEDGTWRLDLIYFSPEGDAQLVSQEEFEANVDQRVPVFSDAFEDAWLGHYEVRIFRDDLHVETRSINIAEGMTASVHYNGKHGNFQTPIPDANSLEFTGASIQFAKFTHKSIFFNSENLGVKRCSLEQPAKFRTPEGSELEVVFEPNRLEAYLPFDSKRPTWESAKQSIRFEELDPERSMRIRVPDDIYEPHLTVLDVRSKVSTRTAMSKVGGGVFEARLADVFPDDLRHGKKIVALTWKATTVSALYGQYFKAQRKAGRYAKSYADFAKEKSIPEEVSHLFTVSFSRTLEGASVVEDRLELKLNQSNQQSNSALSTPMVLVWPLLAPPRQPVEIPIHGSKVDLPANLKACGPLVVDVIHRSLFGATATSSRPSPRALVVENRGYFVDDQDPLALNALVLSGNVSSAQHRSEELTQMAMELQNQWMHVFEQAKGNESVRSLQHRLRDIVESDPRGALDALEKSQISPELLPSVFINCGLSQLDYSVDDTLDDFGPVVWLELFDEMNDLRVLKRTRYESMSRRNEWQESVGYVDQHGGAQLLDLISGKDEFQILPATDELIGRLRKTPVELQNERQSLSRQRLLTPDASLRALLQLLERRSELSKKVALLQLKKVAEDNDHLLRFCNSKSVNMHLADLRRLAFDLTKSNEPGSWPWVPYVSFVFACIARMSAHHLIHPVPELQKAMNEWSLLARRVPELVEIDFVLAEALSLTTHSPVIERMK